MLEQDTMEESAAVATSTSCFFGIDGDGGLMAGGELKRMHPIGLKVE